MIVTNNIMAKMRTTITMIVVAVSLMHASSVSSVSCLQKALSYEYDILLNEGGAR